MAKVKSLFTVKYEGVYYYPGSIFSVKDEDLPSLKNEGAIEIVPSTPPSTSRTRRKKQ